MQKFKVLIVDDEPVILETTAQLLSLTFQVEIFTAESCLQAIEIIKLNQIDIIISDIKMPKMSGLDMVAILKNQGYENPIIISSGYADKDNLFKALNLQIFSFLEKPFNSEQLFLTVQKAYEASQKKNKVKISNLGLKQLQQKIISMVIEGYTNSEIAEKHNLTEQAIKYHIGRLLKKYGASNRGELVVKMLSMSENTKTG